MILSHLNHWEFLSDDDYHKEESEEEAVQCTYSCLFRTKLAVDGYISASRLKPQEDPMIVTDQIVLCPNQCKLLHVLYLDHDQTRSM